MRYLVRVLAYVKPFRGLAAASVLLTLLVSLLGLLAPWPLKILFDSVLGDHPLPAGIEPLLEPFGEDRTRLLLVIVVAGLAITLIANGLKVVGSHVETRLSQGMILNFRSDLFQHAQRLSMAFHDRSRSGGLIFAINFQADHAAGLVMVLQPLAQSALTLVGMFWITYQIHARLALVSLVIVPILYWAVGFYMAHIQERLRRVKALEGESLSIIHEAISMMKVIVAFGREAHQHRKFREQGERAVDERVKVTVRQTAFSLLVNTTTAIGTALVLGYGVSLILNGQMTSGELLVVLAYVASIYAPLSSLSTTIGSLQDRFTSLEVAFDLLDTEPEIRDRPGAVNVGRTTGHVAFEDVSFSYDGRQSTLQGATFEARPGQTIGIVGATGAGKSTLVSLIPRFYDPQSGTIRLDGRDIRDFTLASLRRQVSLVMQEPLLFSGSIEDNIRFARLGASREEIQVAAKAANAHDFIMKLPKRYATSLGERGAMLSGGERQRISVARAFLKDAPILILDEPTSAIDSRTEAVILDALERLMRGRTTFMIAHRLSTLRSADLILVMHGGRIVGSGTHDQLMARKGLYAEMWTLQAESMTRAGAPGAHRPEAAGVLAGVRS
jgi:ABC-type multidrug transport system fused ATPase/permease subunit